MNIPENLHYTKDHEWIKPNGGTVTVGVTEFAVEQLGDITLVELPEVGDEIKAGEVMGTIESVKAVSDLYTPIDGVIKSINGDLEDEPEKVNTDCYGAGWMVEIETATDPGELLDAAGYRAVLEAIDD